MSQWRVDLVASAIAIYKVDVVTFAQNEKKTEAKGKRKIEKEKKENYSTLGFPYAHAL